MPDKRNYSMDQVAIRMVSQPPVLTDYPVNSPEAAVRMVNDLIKDWDRECMVVINLKKDLTPINMSICSIGTLDASLASPRELMKTSILSNAASTMLFHLHPSGSLEPSKEDIRLTNRMQEVGTLLEIPIIDHIIIGPNEQYYSFHEKSILPVPVYQASSNLDDIQLGTKAAEKGSHYRTRSNPETLKKNIEETTKKLEEGIKNFFNSGNFQEYLKVMAKFHNYSYSNSILIALQRPDASLLQGFSGWKKNFNRHVNAGEKGIKIFAPAPIKRKELRDVVDPVTKQTIIGSDGKPLQEEVEIKIPNFKVVTVFDYAQTSGDPLPELGIKKLEGNIPDYDKLFEAIRRTAKIPITFEHITSGANGYYHKAENRIAINEGMSQAQTTKTALHELAHSIYHSLEAMKNREGAKDRNAIEVEAEAISYTVFEHFNLGQEYEDAGVYSFPYITSWSSGKELPELKSSLETIREGAALIINEIEQHLEEIEHEVSLQGEIDITTEDSSDKLASDIALFSKEYDPYEFNDIGTELGDFEKEVLSYLETGDTAGIKSWLQSIVDEQDEYSTDAQALITRIDAFAQEHTADKDIAALEFDPYKDSSIRFYVAECMEFPDFGEYHEVASLSEALVIYNQIPSDRINGVKGIGFIVEGNEDYNSPFPLMQGNKLQTDLIKMVPFYRDHPLVRDAAKEMQHMLESNQAVKEVKSHYRPEKQSTEKVKSAPTKTNKKEPAKKPSVLAKLRANQKAIAESGKNKPSVNRNKPQLS